MKKLFTLLAFAFLALPAAAGISYNVFPEEETVNSLDIVVVEFLNCDEITYDSDLGISVTFDGQEYSGTVMAYEGGPSLYIQFMPAVSEKGTLIITLKKGCVTTVVNKEDGSSDTETLAGDLPIIYEVEGGSPVSFEWSVFPSSGKVKELSKVTVYFPEFEEIETFHKDEITVLYQGVPLENVTVTNPYGTERLELIFDPVQTAAGTYEVYIPENSIGGFLEGNYEDAYPLDKDISIFYTIAADPNAVDFSFTLDPIEGEVSSLDKVSFDFKALTSVSVDTSAIKVTLDGESLPAGAVSAEITEALPNVLNVNFLNPLKTPGKVEIVIPAGKLTGRNSKKKEGTNPSVIKATYNIVAPGDPVVYDLEFTKGKPQFKTADNDGIIDINDVDLEVMTFNVPVADLNVKDKVAVTFESEDGFFYTGGILKFSMTSSNGAFNTFSQFKVSFPQLPRANGTYFITIPKGSFGDAAWLINPETGHSNPELKLEYTLVGFAEDDETVYDIEPKTIDPAPDTTVKDLSSITLTFAEGIGMTDDCDIILQSLENRYMQVAEVTPGKNNTYVLTFRQKPYYIGTYSLIVAKGSFGDTTYRTDGTSGHANDDLFYSWILSFTDSVEGIAADEADEDIFTVSGLKVKGENLPAGLYIKGGKKLIIR